MDFWSAIPWILMLLAGICLVDCVLRPVRSKLIWSVLLLAATVLACPIILENIDIGYDALLFAPVIIAAYAITGRNKLIQSSTSGQSSSNSGLNGAQPLSNSNALSSLFRVIGGLVIVGTLGFIGLIIYVMMTFSLNFGSNK